MYCALDLGISVADFWHMSARAIIYTHRAMIKATTRGTQQRAEAKSGGVRLNYIPRP